MINVYCLHIFEHHGTCIVMSNESYYGVTLALYPSDSPLMSFATSSVNVVIPFDKYQS